MIPIREKSYDKPVNPGAEAASIPARSLLYHLEPIGVGTPFVESLTGYIQRLAFRHNVTTGTLMAKTIIPAMDNRKLNDTIYRGGSRIYERAYSFNGQSQSALRFVKILERLTLREGLIYLTLLPWADVLPCKTLFRKTRAWCSMCYEKWLKEGNAVYEPLIWTLTTVNVCPEHYQPLVSECRHCHQTMSIHNRTSRPGHCSKCHGWLGESIEQYKPYTLNTCDMENFKTLIAISPKLARFSKRQTVLDGLRKHIDNYYGSITSRFARAFHIPKSSVKRWLQGAYPSLYVLLNLCRYTKTPLVELLTKGELYPLAGQQDHAAAYMQRSVIASRFARQLDYTEIKEKLEHILTNYLNLKDRFEVLPSMEQVAKKLGCSKRMLYQRFPELCKGIAAKSRENRELRKQARLGLICNTVRKICRNTYPSYDSVAKALGPQAGVLREKAVRVVWKEESALFTGKTDSI